MDIEEIKKALDKATVGDTVPLAFIKAQLWIIERLEPDLEVKEALDSLALCACHCSGCQDSIAMVQGAL